jgi:hypothetical protein
MAPDIPGGWPAGTPADKRGGFRVSGAGMRAQQGIDEEVDQRRAG